MGLKDLLVHVDNDPAGSARVDVAAVLAARHEAHLTGLHPMGWSRLPGYLELELPATFLDAVSPARSAHDWSARPVSVRGFQNRSRRPGASN